MPSLNRRSVLAAFAAGAAVPLVGSQPAHAGAAASAAAVEGDVVSFARQRIPGLIAFGDPGWFPDPVRGDLTVETVPGGRTRVSDAKGVLATLTTGARTVTVRGPRRSFTEQKRPFADVFARTVVDGWGTSPGGGRWSRTNGETADYRVEPGQGVIRLARTNASYFMTLNDPAIGDFDCVATVSLSTAPAGADSSIALTFGYQDFDNHYRARLAFSPSGAVRLSVDRELIGVPLALAAGVNVGTGIGRWHVRVARSGSTSQAKAWRDGTAEPGWTHTVQDTTFGAGKLGVRAIASTNSTASNQAQVHKFEATGTWARPPVVTHDTWVRVLPEPFTGWNTETEIRVRAWATDVSPDVLAYCAMLQTGAAPYFEGGRQVLGESGYGPLNPDGTRIEGADFHEYMGVAWQFPTGETRPAPGPQWHRTLDCSGMVRMVFGYHLGVPMNYTGVVSGHLPRRSRDIGPNGPGVIVHNDRTYTDVQPGDLVVFDADAEEATGQLDHVGVYIGRDQDGRYRFASSRKTVNGPTISDLGGASTLDGTGTYAQSLRIVRRV
ncbi:NlpC/P60 family protein [Lentzea sp. JNUCC 0626]|uniref:NlpC/P60 family protein n=1 Tax=Lentzea sp. JNUCC 0626 TaxID=3367513 RepID=UPI00374949EB